MDQRLSPFGQRRAGQYHLGAKRRRLLYSSEHKKTSDLDFIPESSYQNPEEDK